VREKGDLCQPISIRQDIGRFHLEFVFVDTDTLEIGILPCHLAQPFPCPAPDFQDGASAREVAFREQFPRQQLAHLLDDDALELDVVIDVAGQFFTSYHRRCSFSHIIHSC
jgi:hypothetical protein